MATFKRILCPVDFSADARRVLRYAGATARFYGARLMVLHVFPDAPAVEIIPAIATASATPSGLPPAEHGRLREIASQFVRREVPDGVDVELHIPDGRDPGREIAYEAEVLESDLIVMGTHPSRGLERLRKGSVAEFVARSAPCPVIVVPPGKGMPAAPGDVGFDRILCGVDFTESSLDALRAALSLAGDADASLTLLNVSKDGEADRAAHSEHLRQLVPESAGVYCHIDTLATVGPPAGELLRLARERRADVIVLGVRGRGALDRLLFGSTTQDVLRSAPCPVLIQRGSLRE